MRLLDSLRQLHFFGIGILLSSTLSCGSFQYAGTTYDDIYDDQLTDHVYNEEIVAQTESPQEVNQSSSSDYYRNQLREIASEYEDQDEVITNIDEYSSGSYNENSESPIAYSGWGQESDEIQVNIYNNFGYSPYWRPYFRPWNYWSVGFSNWYAFNGFDYWGPSYYAYGPWYNPYYYGGFYGQPFYGYPYYGPYYNQGFYRSGRDVVFVNGHRGGRGASSTGLLSASGRESFQRTMSRATRGTRSATHLNTRPNSSLFNGRERPSRGDANTRPVNSTRPVSRSRPDTSRPSNSRPNTIRPSNSSRPTSVRPNNSSRPTSSQRVSRPSSRRVIKDSPASASNYNRPNSTSRPVSTNQSTGRTRSVVSKSAPKYSSTRSNSSSSSRSSASRTSTSRGNSGGRRGNN